MTAEAYRMVLDQAKACVWLKIFSVGLGFTVAKLAQKVQQQQKEIDRLKHDIEELKQ